jgi:gluconolactonase
MFPAPPEFFAEVFTSLPTALDYSGKQSEMARHRGMPLHSFLEGPAFDHTGNLYCVDVAHGRIFKILPTGQWTTFIEYEGQPNGLKIHPDGRIIVADRRLGLVAFHPTTKAASIIVDNFNGQRFKGINDLTLAPNGDIFFTDQGNSALDDQSGQVFRLKADGDLQLMMSGLNSPNGLVLNRAADCLMVALTRANQIIRIPLRHGGDGGINKPSVFIQLSGGLAGPDGIAVDANDNLAIAHSGLGTVWIMSRLGEPMLRIKSPKGIRTTNLAFASDADHTIFITVSDSGCILRASIANACSRLANKSE